MSEEMKELQTNEVTETMADYEDHFDDANPWNRVQDYMDKKTVLHSLPLFLLLHLSVILSFLRSLKAPHFLFLVNQKYNICMRKNTTKEPKSVKKMKNAVGLIEKKCYSTY